MTNPALELATTATNQVQAIGIPIVALGVALLGLTIAVAVIAYVMTRTPKGD